VSTDPADPSPHTPDEITPGRLATIENQLDHIDTRLSIITEFNGRLDEIHTILETRAGDSTLETGFQVVAHVSRDNSGTRPVADVTWPDMWAARLFVTALLRNLAHKGLAHQHRRCWCEVWAPDEAGQFVDSAILNPDTDTDTIEWESDTVHDTKPS
jgi:hypothetical protein